MFIQEIALILIVAVILGLILHRIKQPLVIAYIATGIIVGPQVLGWLQSAHELEIFSKAGIIFLLFIVGLHLNPKILKEVGTTALVTGIGQIVFTSVIGFGMISLLGYGVIDAIFIAIALTFSSTIIIMKLLSDKGELFSLHAKISIGFLLVQDLAATLILIAIPITANSNQRWTESVLPLLGASLTSLLVLIMIARWILPKLLRVAAESQELLFMLAISWGLGVAALLAAVGLSIEVGALVAGILMSTSIYAEEIASRLRPVRDFFLVTFFVLLGSQLAFSETLAVLAPALLLSLFVLVGNPLIVFILLVMLGYSRQVSFKAGLAVAQISEFSLIMMALAAQYFTFADTTMMLVTVVGLITIGVSTYMIMYADGLYRLVEPVLTKIPIPILINRKTRTHIRKKKQTAYWFGVDPIQDSIAQLFKGTSVQPVYIDYDPDHVEFVKQRGRSAMYGDASNVEFLSQLDWEQADYVVSIIPNDMINRLIIQHATSVSHPPKIFATAREKSSAQTLEKDGAHHVSLPVHLSIEHIHRLIID